MKNAKGPVDVLLIGAGIMSATLGSLLKEVEPDWEIRVLEKLHSPGEESSNEWNNAGTGHSALCELNYTSEKENGKIDISKAVKVNEQFQLSLQYWAYLVQQELIDDPQSFIRSIPHVSMVQGDENIAFLKKRMEALSKNPLFQGMAFTDNHDVLAEWLPLMMEGRDPDERIAATKVDTGTDVNFGALTRSMFDYLLTKGVDVQYGCEVRTIKRTAEGLWEVTFWNEATRSIESQETKFLFIGAGGGSLTLLQKTRIPEAKKIGGFPVSGLFLVCKDRDIAEQHHAKVYGKAKVGAPPMSVPHLDTRYINGEKSLLFGPFAGFSPKFLKTGSMWDLPKSVTSDNLLTMLAAGVKEMELTKYLVSQLMLSHEDRMEELREFIPYAQSDQWEVVVAGQRVQVIKDTKEGGKGTLQFGTEVVNSADGSVAALLGASPGASTAVYVMLEVMERCFQEKMEEWLPKVKEMIPTYGRELSKKPALFKEIFAENQRTLCLVNQALHGETLPESS